MLYIYDILVNFMDGDRIYEFFEWDFKDVIEHIKKIPVIRVNDQTFLDFVQQDVRVDSSFLNSIKDKTCTYKEVIPYAVLISNQERCYALEFNQYGDVLFKSSLLIDEEEEVIECSRKLEETMISYTVVKENTFHTVFTRKEEIGRNLLLREISSTYQAKDYEKLNYLYEEAYGKDPLTIEEKYQRLLEDIENNFTSNLKKLIAIIQLSHKKKKTI